MGQRVVHSKFGEGIILQLEGERDQARAQVNFSDAGVKWLMLKYANFTYPSPSAAEYIRKKLQINVDYDQAIAVSETGSNILATARAGSGKTTVIACKTFLLIDHEKIHPDHILLLAFNKKAAVEMSNRIRRNCRLDDFHNARTFHSLAYQLVQPNKNIQLLFDEDDNSRQSQFIQNLIKTTWNPVQQKRMYETFRAEIRELENIGEFMNQDEYFIFRRNYSQALLNGTNVKSLGEKYIGDFLYEHGIAFQYEPVVYWGSRHYRPDFILDGRQLGLRNIVIEHWAIDPTDHAPQLPEFWDRMGRDYQEEMQRKREFWAEKSDAVLIETSVADLSGGREDFETRLKEKLEAAGLRLRKRPEAELIREVFESPLHITKLAGLFLQFIQKAKKRRWPPTEVYRRIACHSANSDKERDFLALASDIYDQYEAELKRTGQMDFDDLLWQAIAKVRTTRGQCDIRVTADRHVRMNELKWLLIDEYQDFSVLFDELVGAIRQFNPELKLFCVGDDWQAINGFAGSDLHYFDTFTKRLANSDRSNLLNNYRSSVAIVDYANQVMAGRGEPSKPHRNDATGQIRLAYVDEVWIDARNRGDAPFLVDRTVLGRSDGGQMIARHLEVS